MSTIALIINTFGLSSPCAGCAQICLQFAGDRSVYFSCWGLFTESSQRAKRRLRGAFVLLQTFLTDCLQPLCMLGLFMSLVDAAVRMPRAPNKPEICHNLLLLPRRLRHKRVIQLHKTSWGSSCIFSFNFLLYSFYLVVFQSLTSSTPCTSNYINPTSGMLTVLQIENVSPCYWFWSGITPADVSALRLDFYSFILRWHVAFSFALRGSRLQWRSWVTARDKQTEIWRTSSIGRTF